METKICMQAGRVEEIRAICQEYGNEPGELINILHAVQGKYGYLPMNIQQLIAVELNIPASTIYGVVTFYSYFTMKPKGKYPISICMGTACYVRGAEKILDEFKRKLDIGIGDTTADGMFSLDCLRCVGACGLAPVVMVGAKVFGRLSTDKVHEILDEFYHQEALERN